MIMSGTTILLSLNCGKCAPKLNTLRSLHTTPNFFKGNPRRPKVLASGPNLKSKSKRDSARELLSMANRTKWEESNNLLEVLKDKFPTTNVYLAENFAPRLLSLSDAVKCLRESGDPSMYDCMGNPVRAKFTLNMRTKKKTKFINKFESHIVLPNVLDFIPKRRVIALCKDVDEAKIAIQEGAFQAGGAELLSRLEHGAFHWEEYDTVVAHSEWEAAVTKLRHMLKDRLPTVKNGRIGENVPSIVSTQAKGVSLESQPLDGVPEINFLDVIIGQVSWELDLLEANLKAYVDAIHIGKSPRIVGEAVSAIELSCPPTGEHFLLDHKVYVQHLMDSDRSNGDLLESELTPSDHPSEQSADFQLVPS